jgi:outer membrane biogenesis lipoprotein LolB
LRKITGLLLCGLILCSCSITRNRGVNNSVNYGVKAGENIYKTIQNQNVTLSNFFVQKAEVEIVNEEGRQKFLCNIKFEKPDRYLISLKSRTGIEGARIYISNDTILVNDRINKKLYFGNSLSLVRKYGLSISCLPLIFGDLVLENNFNHGNDICEGEKLDLSCVVKGIPLKYEIDCKKRKVIGVSKENTYVSKGFNIDYKNFMEINGSLIPKTIEITDVQYNTNIRIKIIKMESPWIGTIKFVPGKGYEIIELE